MKNLLFLILFSGIITTVFCQENPHGTAFDISCNICHTSTNWYDISKNTFDHDQTEFTLLGAHKKVNCVSCHNSIKFNNTPKNCFECHTDIHKNEFGNGCKECHTERGWDNRSGFVQFHNQTDFPLTGVHAMIDCESCHFNEQQRQFANTPIECSNCHLAIFMTTLNPDHQRAGFDLDCQNCHLTHSKGWVRSIFAHSDIIPLTGGHAGLACEDCHQNNQLTHLPTECVSCHQQEYDSANNPNHLAANFPTTCENCHTFKGWEPAKWDHDNDYFPIYSGKHREEWDDCSDCHVNSANYAQFECIYCHEHLQSEMDDEHRERRDYVYESQACFDCHPRGRE